MSSPPVLVWFRQDLRLADNPALAMAVESGAPVIPVFIRETSGRDPWSPGAASRWWLHESLVALTASLAECGLPLILRSGEVLATLDELIAETGAQAVFWNRCYEPYAIARDKTIKNHLTARGITAKSGNAGLLFEPWRITREGGGSYRVFSAFWRACRAAEAHMRPEPRPTRMRPPENPPASESLTTWNLQPKSPDWAGGLRDTWTPGEAGALARLDRFLERAARYAADRDRPDREATSRLSPHLHWGEISPRTIWNRIAAAAAAGRIPAADEEKFLSELGWREFSHHLLFHVPDLAEQPLRPEFSEFPWTACEADIARWRRGMTGFPIVDAGMRQLWQTGWMHNRVRMIAASFLVKDLLAPWQVGAAWFWDTLVDADLANNAASWQWVAGCGADAAPYFRIFNPILQGERFDPAGDYVRTYCPELARLPASVIHRPWEADSATLREAGVRLGQTYPAPMIDHGKARRRALDAFERIKSSAA
ncbi:MAG: deoxyribodipyrimidine photo-lyase [Alphaproteobacteria bacterium]|nr:deoxyribodipyrimidine photo-lyase [Alphaproteobacteria bacterium]